MDKRLSVQMWLGIQPRKDENLTLFCSFGGYRSRRWDSWLCVSGGGGGQDTGHTYCSPHGQEAKERTNQSPTTLQGNNLKTYPKPPISKDYSVSQWCHPGDQSYIL